MATLQDLLLQGSAIDASVIYAGRHCTGPATPHEVPGGCFHFVRSGRAEVVLPGRNPLLIDQPSLVFFAQASRHAVRPLDPEGVEMVCAVVTYDHAFRRAVELLFPDHLVIPLYHLAAVAHVLEAFFHEALSSAPGAKALADRLCLVVLTYLCRQVLLEGDSSPGLMAACRDRRIAAAVRAIHQRFDENLTLDDIAAVARMSRSRFSVRFSEVVGRSPHQYLVDYRIGVAKRLLEAGLPVKVVASRVGYGTVPAFVRKFKDVAGTTPGNWPA